MDCKDGLERLSGHLGVRGEEYTFKQTSRGWNIYVNGRLSSCWVDNQGRIGSLSKGGPSLYQWLVWFGHRPGEVARIIRDVYPELGGLE